MRGLASACGVACLVLLAGLALQAAPARGAGQAMPFQKPLTASVDGAISPGEYPGSFTDATTGMEVDWGQDGTNMTVGLVSPGLGWAAIGFGPQGALMDGSNVIIGYVAGGATAISDEFGVGWEHHADTSLGGTNDILAYAGSESGGHTVLEFRFPLVTADPHDTPLRPGRTYSMILAYSDTADDFVTIHTAASFSEITVAPDPSRVPTRHAAVSMGYEGDAAQGGNVTLVARVLEDDGTPLASGLVDFVVNTSVGPGALDSVETNATGVAALNYTFLSGGEFDFSAHFEGDQDFLPADAYLAVDAAGAPPAGTSAWDLAVRVILVAVLAGVVLAYAYSLRQVLRVRGIGLTAERERRAQRRAARPAGSKGAGTRPDRGPEGGR